MRRRLALSLAVAAALASLGPAALAYEMRGFDPDDRKAVGGDPDIRSTILRVGPTEHGRALVLVIRAYETLSDWWTVEARLDAQGERRADHILLLWNSDTGGAGCTIHERRDHETERGAFHQHGRAARCRVPIRWRLVSTSGYDGDLEVAPNRGMYG